MSDKTQWTSQRCYCHTSGLGFLKHLSQNASIKSILLFRRVTHVQLEMRRRCQNHQGGNRHGQEEEEEQDAVWGKHLTRRDNFSPQGALNVYWYGFYGEFSHGQPQSELTLIRHSTSIIREGEIWYGGRHKGFSLIELKVVPMTSATCFHSSSCCSFLSFSSHLSSFLSMVEETFSSTRNTRGSTLSTTKRLSSVQLCHDVTIMSLPLFSGSRSQEWTLLSVTVCPLL